MYILRSLLRSIRSRTDGVDTYGAAAKNMRSAVAPLVLTPFVEYPKSPSVKKHVICSDPISADTICPFPKYVYIYVYIYIYIYI